MIPYLWEQKEFAQQSGQIENKFHFEAREWDPRIFSAYELKS